MEAARPEADPTHEPRVERLEQSARSVAVRDPSGWIALALILLAGVALRVWILMSPLGAVEADESVVGLMALHIQAGERPAFYWGQPVLGSLEAYLVAVAFVLAEPSNLVLKSVTGFVYLLFVVLVYLQSHRDYGRRVALLSALYLALPPSFLAFWSLKARGGYVELLAIGQALFLLAPWIVCPTRGRAWKLGLAGLLSGSLLWIHPLGLVYILPVGLYLVVRLGRSLLGRPILAGAVGLLIGLAPALIYNLEHDGESFTALAAGGSSQQAFQENISSLVQVGLPIMLGLGQATSSAVLFAEDWPQRPGHWPWIVALLLSTIALALLPSLRAVRLLFRQPDSNRSATAFFGLAVVALTPLVASLGRFGELVAEPRYALPLYSAVPLFVAAEVELARRRRLIATFLAILVFGLNVYSLVTADPRLNLPTTAGASSEATRAELLEYLNRHSLSEIYTDYWLAYPLMFESRERVMASVSSGGYNRFAPYAYFVSVSARPAFVFLRGSVDDSGFQTRLTEVGGRAVRDEVSIYDVYSSIEPLDRLRP